MPQRRAACCTGITALQDGTACRKPARHGCTRGWQQWRGWSAPSVWRRTCAGAVDSMLRVHARHVCAPGRLTTRRSERHCATNCCGLKREWSGCLGSGVPSLDRSCGQLRSALLAASSLIMLLARKLEGAFAACTRGYSIQHSNTTWTFRAVLGLHLLRGTFEVLLTRMRRGGRRLATACAYAWPALLQRVPCRQAQRPHSRVSHRYSRRWHPSECYLAQRTISSAHLCAAVGS